MWCKGWLEKLEGHGLVAVHRALTAVVDAPPGQPISSGTAQQALAASEVVAAGLGKPAAGLPPGAQRVAEALKPQIQTLRTHARAAVERVRRERVDVDPDDQWDEPDAATDQANADARDWRTQMDLLSLRLSD
jgi:hypothetical protein